MNQITYLNSSWTRAQHTHAVGVHNSQIIVGQNMTRLSGQIEIFQREFIVRLDAISSCNEIMLYFIFVMYTNNNLLKYMVPSCSWPSTQPWSAACVKYDNALIESLGTPKPLRYISPNPLCPTGSPISDALEKY